MKDAAAESFKSSMCETVTVAHSEIAFYALLKRKKKKTKKPTSLTCREA